MSLYIIMSPKPLSIIIETLLSIILNQCNILGQFLFFAILLFKTVVFLALLSLSLFPNFLIFTVVYLFLFLFFTLSLLSYLLLSL